VNDVTREGFTFNAGTLLTETYIDSLPTVPMREAAHAMNRRTEFSIISNDFVPKPRIRTDLDSVNVQIITEPEIKSVKYRLTPTGAIESDCIVNGINFNFIYDRKAIRPTISLGSALRLLKDGAITRADFQGDPERIFREGSIANRSIFTAKTIQIGKMKLENVEIQVDHQLTNQITFGEITLLQFGEYEMDEENMQIIFK
jgi:hypothetical protein